VPKSSGSVAIGNASPVTTKAKTIVMIVVPVKRWFHPSLFIWSDLRGTGSRSLTKAPTKDPANQTACTVVTMGAVSSPFCARQGIMSVAAKVASNSARNTTLSFTEFTSLRQLRSIEKISVSTRELCYRRFFHKSLNVEATPLHLEESEKGGVANLIGANQEGATDQALNIRAEGAVNVKGYVLGQEV